MRTIRIVRNFAGLMAVFTCLSGCSEQQLPLMTTAQQQTYNSCMSGHWSGEADTLWWGPFGWSYHNSLTNDCLAKSGSLGEAGATTTTVPAVGAQPVSPVPNGVAPAAPAAPVAPVS